MSNDNPSGLVRLLWEKTINPDVFQVQDEETMKQNPREFFFMGSAEFQTRIDDFLFAEAVQVYPKIIENQGHELFQEFWSEKWSIMYREQVGRALKNLTR